MLDDVLGPPELSVGELDLAVAHRHARLEEEPPGSVVEHHDEQLGRGAEHRALFVGVGRGECGHLRGILRG